MFPWYRDQKAEPQADGDDGETVIGPTRFYLNSVEQDEALYRLRHDVARLQRDVAALHKMVAK